MSKSEKDLLLLKTTVEATSSLIEQLVSLIKASRTGSPASQKQLNDIDAISLAWDASSLIRAHTTKLSLLIINTPFTPTAIHTVLRELTSGPLPALATAVEVCSAASYTKIMRSELQWRVNRVLVELLSLIKMIPVEDEELKDGSAGVGKEVTLAATGVLWQACDDVMALKELGVAGLIIKKAGQYQETLKDALEELREWEEETSNNDEEPEGRVEVLESGDINTSNDTLVNFFDYPHHIPANDSLQIRERLSKFLQRLKLIQHLYSAIIKRRLKTLPILPLRSDLFPRLGNVVERVDEIMSILKRLPDLTDELAIAFYEFDLKEIDRRMDDCFSSSFSASELSALNWKGEKDEFSTWVRFPKSFFIECAIRVSLTSTSL